MSHAQDDHRNRVPFCHEREIGALGKIFSRKKRFEDTSRLSIRRFLSPTTLIDVISSSRLNFQIGCGFCERSHRFDGSKARNHHMANHFEEGRDMTKWKDPCTSGRIINDGTTTMTMMNPDGDGEE